MTKQQVIDILEAYKPSGNWMISGEFWYEKSDPAITHWMLLPELPEVEQ